jgi:AsmA protein
MILHQSANVRAGSFCIEFGFANVRFEAKNSVLKVSQVPITLTGWTDFDGRLNYQVRADQIGARLARETRGLLSDLPFNLEELMAMRLSGTIDHLELQMVESRFAQDRGGPGSARPADNHNKIRELSRQLRDRILR